MGQGCTKDQKALKSILATEVYSAPHNEMQNSNTDGAEDDENSEQFQSNTRASSSAVNNEKKYNIDETFLSPYVQELLSRLTYCELQILLVSLNIFSTVDG